MKLLLFDIDGTILSCGGAGRAALTQAVEEVYKADKIMDKVRLAGGTDYGIFDAIFQEHFGRLPSDVQEIQMGLERYLELLPLHLARSDYAFKVLPGAEKAIRRLAKEPDYLLGIATGNVERGAKAKLERARLWEYFQLGGYGSDSKLRSGLVAKAIERATEFTDQKGFDRISKNDIFVIGDTEFDIRSAHEVGVKSIGVRMGSSHVDDMIREKPSFLVESFEDDHFWQAIGLDHA